MDDEDKKSIPGLIPDFFHDVIAYFIPGFTFVLLIALNYLIAFGKPQLLSQDNAILTSLLAVFVSYIFGKFFEQIGYLTIHHGFSYKAYSWCSLQNKNKCSSKNSYDCTTKNKWKRHKPKWDILFNKQDKSYTSQFKETLTNKINDWLKNLDGEKLLKDCEENHKDDYFNLIQFYLRERFPQVALYEKKQNATIVLTRSLCIIFFINPFIYCVTLFTFLADTEKLVFSKPALLYFIINYIFSVVFYTRFRLDQKYHAMYIYEAFLATKKLLTLKQPIATTDQNDGSSG